MGSLYSLVLSCILVFFGSSIANFYTPIPNLRAKVAEVLHFYAFYHLLDGNKSVACGAMRGLCR
jgi:Na+-driven multidrug efflux pump